MSVITLLLITLFPQARVIYVNHAAIGAADGSSWADAYNDLHPALAAATSGDQVWIAQGTYTPTATTDRRATFYVDAAIELYGGFDGTETTLAQRDWNTHVTILSGEIGSSLKSDNSANVMTVEHQDSTSFILDGVQVRDGYAESGFSNTGGGIKFSLGSATIRNTVFSQNFAKLSGGALQAAAGCALVVSHCTFLENVSMWEGGAIQCFDLTATDSLFVDNFAEWEGGAISLLLSNPAQVARCEFIDNTGPITGGGGVSCKGRGKTLLITECRFYANHIGGDGGALMLSQGGELLVDRSEFRANLTGYTAGLGAAGGAIFIDYTGSHPTSGLIANSLFTENVAGRGGAIYSCGGVNIVGNTVVANEARSSSYNSGAGINLGLDLNHDWDFNGPTELVNNIVWFNFDPSGQTRSTQEFREYRHPGQTQYCGIQGVLAGDPWQNRGSNPQFRNPSRGDFRLKSYSPLINAGHPRALAHLGAFLFDFEGQPRLQGLAIDIGADEVR